MADVDGGQWINGLWSIIYGQLLNWHKKSRPRLGRLFVLTQWLILLSPLPS